jgi:hypothetical protein
MLVRSITACCRSVPLATTIRTISTRPSTLQKTSHGSFVSSSRTLRRSDVGHLGKIEAVEAEKSLAGRIRAFGFAQTRWYSTEPSNTKPVLPNSVRASLQSLPHRLQTHRHNPHPKNLLSLRIPQPAHRQSCENHLGRSPTRSPSRVSSRVPSSATASSRVNSNGRRGS